MLVLSLVTQRSNYISFCYSVEMDLESIKELLLSPRPSEEYLAGVAGFLDFAYIGKSSDAKILCPCVICVNGSLRKREDVYDHLDILFGVAMGKQHHSSLLTNKVKLQHT